jgi:ribosomal protein L35AE/L33A
MEGIISNFRRARAHQNTKYAVIHLPNTDSKSKAEKFIGKKVTFTTVTGKEISGEIKGTHGNNGCVRVLFEKSLPGQSLGTKVKVA